MDALKEKLAGCTTGCTRERATRRHRKDHEDEVEIIAHRSQIIIAITVKDTN